MHEFTKQMTMFWQKPTPNEYVRKTDWATRSEGVKGSTCGVSILNSPGGTNLYKCRDKLSSPSAKPDPGFGDIFRYPSKFLF
jgi:hypothetical protein